MGSIETFMYFYVAIILGLSIAPFIFVAVTTNTVVIRNICSRCSRCSRIWRSQDKHPNEIPLLQEMNNLDF